MKASALRTCHSDEPEALIVDDPEEAVLLYQKYLQSIVMPTPMNTDHWCMYEGQVFCDICKRDKGWSEWRLNYGALNFETFECATFLCHNCDEASTGYIRSGLDRMALRNCWHDGINPPRYSHPGIHYTRSMRITIEKGPEDLFRKYHMLQKGPQGHYWFRMRWYEDLAEDAHLAFAGDWGAGITPSILEALVGNDR
jgi:hypothetical protein